MKKKDRRLLSKIKPQWAVLRRATHVFCVEHLLLSSYSSAADDIFFSQADYRCLPALKLSFSSLSHFHQWSRGQGLFVSLFCFALLVPFFFLLAFLSFDSCFLAAT